MIRRAAGLGARRREPDPDRYPALRPLRRAGRRRRSGRPRRGACRRGRSGARSSCATSRPKFGGSLLADADARSTASAPNGWARDARQLSARAACRLLPRTTAFGYYAQNFIGLAERITDHLADRRSRLPRERLWQVRAKRGRAGDRRDRAAAGVPDNDRPGIMLADSARALCQPLRRQARRPRRRRRRRMTAPIAPRSI
jgi:sarcosine oxidase subunit alpha